MKPESGRQPRYDERRADECNAKHSHRRGNCDADDFLFLHCIILTVRFARNGQHVRARFTAPFDKLDQEEEGRYAQRRADHVEQRPGCNCNISNADGCEHCP